LHKELVIKKSTPRIKIYRSVIIILLTGWIVGMILGSGEIIYVLLIIAIVSFILMFVETIKNRKLNTLTIKK